MRSLGTWAGSDILRFRSPSVQAGGAVRALALGATGDAQPDFRTWTLKGCRYSGHAWRGLASSPPLGFWGSTDSIYHVGFANLNRHHLLNTVRVGGELEFTGQAL